MSDVVGVESFVRAETDLYLSRAVSIAGGLGMLHHYREPMRADFQTVIRANRDTLYSAAVLDLDAGPATITMPDSRGRFMSLIVINQDHYLPLATAYAPATCVVDRESAQTRYVLAGFRTLIDPNDPDDLARVHALQDSISISQPAQGELVLPDWDEESRSKVRAALVTLADTLPDSRRTFGSVEQVDPIRHLLGTASGWGGNPERDATYFPVTPEHNDGATAYRLTVGDVPIDGFWSVTVYNADGYLEANDGDRYSVNSLTAEPDADGSITIHFGGTDDTVANHLPITAGWNYWVRLYRPRAEVLDGAWTFPPARPV